MYYVYRGQVLYGRLAAMKLTISHFARQAGTMLRILGDRGKDERTIKFIVPTGCDATPDEVMGALRRVCDRWTDPRPQHGAPPI